MASPNIVQHIFMQREHNFCIYIYIAQSVLRSNLKREKLKIF